MGEVENGPVWPMFGYEAEAVSRGQAGVCRLPSGGAVSQQGLAGNLKLDYW